MQLDSTGKVELGHIYEQDDPRLYFRTLRDLDYCIPQLAKPYFAKLIDEYREAERVESITVLDIGCSYGVNAALLRCDASIDELYEWYGGPRSTRMGRDELVARDRALVASRGSDDGLRVVGLDRSGPALSYALEAGLLDGALRADYESGEPTTEERDLLAGVDLVVSTGCYGYVTERTIRRVAEASPARRPWMAHFALRMFPYAPVAESLAGLGYETGRVGGLFKQRRFASDQEAAEVLENLAAVGVDPRGHEDEGWLYAELHVSRPVAPGGPGGRGPAGQAAAGWGPAGRGSFDTGMTS